MKCFKTRALSLLLVLVLLMSLNVTAAAAAVSNDKLEQALNGSAAYMLIAAKNPQVGSIGGEWAVVGLARSGYNVPQSYWDAYYTTVENYVKACKGVLHEKKYTEYSRVVLALTAIGADPANVGGYNLLTPLGDFDKTVWQGINGPVWALIALDSGSYDMPVNSAAATQATRQMYLDEILRRQLDSGGWNLSDVGGSGKADPDVTGMALQALAGYQDQAAVKTATEKALACLSEMQDSDGGYSSWETSNSESIVQVIVALCELGVDLNDGRFVKNGNTVLDNLLSYRQNNGGFVHTSAGNGSNQMASEQGLYGMAAAWRAAKGSAGLYRMDDVTISAAGSTGTNAAGLTGKHADVKKVNIVSPGKTFDDISAHKNQTAIEGLASRAIISGRDSKHFDPNATMTRAEFAAIVVKSLGLTSKANQAFTDVKSGDWFAGFVGTASDYGIVSGVGGGKFDPNGTITRQEAAVMVAKAAELCGMDVNMDDVSIRDTLAQFSDYTASEQWARESLAFCYQTDILDDSVLKIEASTAIKRCEIAQMLFNLLESANLL